MNKKEIRVLVTAIGGNSVGYQILKALKTAKLTNYIIYGADNKKYTYQYSLVEDYLVLPKCNASEYLNTLLEFCKKNKIDVLIPGCEPELNVVSNNRGLIESLGIFLPITSSEVLEICSDKLLTNKFLLDNNFHYPKTKVISCIDDIRYVDFFPVVVKPAIGGSGSQGVNLAQNKVQLKNIIEYNNEINNNQDYMIQEYLGTPETEFTCGVLFNMAGDYINTIIFKRDLTSLLSQKTIEKNISNKKYLGNKLVISSGVSQGEFVINKELSDYCKAIGEKLKATSAINIQCRVCQGKIYVFEINPRFSGTSFMRAMVGYNEVDILIREHFYKDKIKTNFPYKLGTITRTLEERLVNEI